MTVACLDVEAEHVVARLKLKRVRGRRLHPDAALLPMLALLRKVNRKAPLASLRAFLPYHERTANHVASRDCVADVGRAEYLVDSLGASFRQVLQPKR